MSTTRISRIYIKDMNITVAFLATVMFLLFASCTDTGKKMADAVVERDSLPSMTSLGVSHDTKS